MASKAKPRTAGAMDVFLETSYYCNTCGCTMNREFYREEDGTKTRIMRCMNRKCDHFNLPYHQPLERVALFIPKDRQPEKPTKAAQIDKKKI